MSWIDKFLDRGPLVIGAGIWAGLMPLICWMVGWWQGDPPFTFRKQPTTVDSAGNVEAHTLPVPFIYEGESVPDKFITRIKQVTDMKVGDIGIVFLGWRLSREGRIWVDPTAEVTPYKGRYDYPDIKVIRAESALFAGVKHKALTKDRQNESDSFYSSRGFIPVSRVSVEE